MEMSFTEKIFSLTAVKYQWRHFRFLFQGTTNLEILKIRHVSVINTLLQKGENVDAVTNVSRNDVKVALLNGY